MSTWADFYPWVMQEVKGITTDYADKHLRASAADFFERSKSYIVDLTVQATTAGNSDYTYNLPANTDMVKVLEAYINGTEAGTENQYRERAARTGVYSLSPTQYRVYPTPAGVGTVAIRAAIKPGAAALGIPDEYFSQHVEAIAWGAMARMMAVSGKPWTDLSAASNYASQFVTKAAEVQSKVLKSYGKARTRSRASFF